MKSLSLSAISALSLVLPQLLFAAETTGRLEKVLSENPQAVETLAAYPDEVRQAALEASLYPNTLIDMGEDQKQTRAQFQTLLSPYPRKTQEKVYNLVRYPELLDGLVQGGEKSKGQIKDLTKGYPKEIQGDAQDLGKKEYPLLQKIQYLYANSDRDFENRIRELPSSGQSAYRTLLRYPEVLDTLSENRNFTLALGEAYRSNPGAARAEFDNFMITATRQNQEALEDYRETLKKDPKAQEELKKSAQEFANQYGYEGDDYGAPPPSGYDGTTVVNISINAYPYWFGYPYWYATPFWRPYPLWYHTGFYAGFGSGFFVWGWPSFWYTNWFYGYPRHFYSYPYLASCYGTYYNRWRNYPVRSGFHHAVGNWDRRHGGDHRSDLWRNDGHRVDRWRDFGHEEERRNWQGRGHPSFRDTVQGSDRHRRGDHPRLNPSHADRMPKDRPGSWGDTHRKDHPGIHGRDRDRTGVHERDRGHAGVHERNRDRSGVHDRGKNQPGENNVTHQGRGRFRPEMGQTNNNDRNVPRTGFRGNNNRGDPGNNLGNNPGNNQSDSGVHQRRSGDWNGGSGNQGRVFQPVSSGRDRGRSTWNSGGSFRDRGSSSWNRSADSSSWGSGRSFRGIDRSSFGGGFRGGSHSGFSRGRR